MTEPAAPSRKKKPRKKGDLLPNTRAIRECERRGWAAGMTEQQIPGTFIKRDFLGVIDLVAADPSIGVLGIQACSDGRSGANSRGSDVGARQAKCELEPRLVAWLKSGARFEIWAWGLRGGVGEEKIPTLRRVRALLVENRIAWQIEEDGAA